MVYILDRLTDCTVFMKIHKLSKFVAGLKIMAGQQTVSGQFWVLTRQTLGLPDVLFCHLRF